MKTVQVRIAVAVGLNGAWVAHGYHGSGEDHSSLEDLLDVFPPLDNETCYWVTADLPIPEVQTVAGRGDLCDRRAR